MEVPYRNLIEQAYTAFNRRDIDTVLQLMTPDVQWPNGWEGGYVQGHAAVRDYWTRQWKELDPTVRPLSIKELGDGRIEVDVQQTVKNRTGTTLFDGRVKHVYTLEGGRIQHMEIAAPHA